MFVNQTESESVIIRSMRAEDNPYVAQLISQLSYECTPRQAQVRMEKIIDHPDYGSFVAQVDGQVVGLLAVHLSFQLTRDGRQARVIALALDSQHRGRGIGSQLMEHLESWLEKQQVTRVMLNTRLDRSAAHMFYERLGFRRTGYRFVKTLED